VPEDKKDYNPRTRPPAKREDLAGRPATHTPPPADELKKELEKCQREKEKFLAGWQRSRADFLNYKKEEMERMREILNYSHTDLILKILPILDDLERGEKALPEDLRSNQFFKGILQIKNHFRDFLKSQGVEEIKTLGEKFDPNFQEVVEEVAANEKESGIVIEEVQKGYLIHGKVLRPAKVRVTK